MSLFRQLLVILLIAGVAAGGWMLLRESPDAASSAAIERTVGASQRAAPVRVAPVTHTTIIESIEVIGTSRARQSVELVPLVEGRVNELLFSAGEVVEPGQVLVTLDDSSQQLALAEAEAVLSDARAQLARTERLQQSGTVAQSRTDELRLAVTAAQAQVDASRQALSDRLVVAPFAGVVGLPEVSRGARVTPSTVIASLDDLSVVMVEFSAPERFYGLIAPGQEVLASSAAFEGERLIATITSVDTRIDPATRSFRARAEAQNPDFRLPSGLFMLVEVPLIERPGLRIPEVAVQIEGSDTFVYRVRDASAERIQVQLGQRLDGFIEVNEGLSATDQVVVEGVHRLRDGAPVQVVSEEPDTPQEQAPALAERSPA